MHSDKQNANFHLEFHNDRDDSHRQSSNLTIKVQKHIFPSIRSVFEYGSPNS